VNEKSLGYCGFEAVPSNVEQSALSISNVEQNALSISNVEQNALSISNVEEKRWMRAGRANLGMLLKMRREFHRRRFNGSAFRCN
jgi:hypothetical protein